MFQLHFSTVCSLGHSILNILNYAHLESRDCQPVNQNSGKKCATGNIREWQNDSNHDPTCTKWNQGWYSSNISTKHNDELTPSYSLKESSLTPLRRFASQGHDTSLLAQAHSDASRTVQYEGAILGWPYLTLVGQGLTNLSNFVARPLPSLWYHCVFIDKNDPLPQGWLAGHRWYDISCGTSDRLDVYKRQTSQASLRFMADSSSKTTNMEEQKPTLASWSVISSNAKRSVEESTPIG